MLYDSTFLIHLAGNRGETRRHAAEYFLSEHPSSPIFTSRVCWSEFAEGYESLEDAERGLFRFAILEIDEDIAWRASRIARNLSRRGLPIGDNDLWIAATALAYDLTIVTLNIRHFSRIPNLTIATY